MSRIYISKHYNAGLKKVRNCFFHKSFLFELKVTDKSGYICSWGQWDR